MNREVCLRLRLALDFLNLLVFCVTCCLPSWPVPVSHWRTRPLWPCMDLAFPVLPPEDPGSSTTS